MKPTSVDVATFQTAIAVEPGISVVAPATTLTNLSATNISKKIAKLGRLTNTSNKSIN